MQRDAVHAGAPAHAAPPGTGRRDLVARMAVLAVCLAAWIAFRLGTGIQLEDALITFRYAENLARGDGFVFNLGERVLGTTSPLMTLLLAACGAAFGVAAIPAAATAIGLAAGVTSLIALDSALAGCGLALGWRLAAMLAAGLHPEMLWATTGGLETPLVICAMAVSLEAMVRGRWYRAAAAAALGVLVRPDGTTWAMIVAAFAAVRLGRRIIGPLALGATILLPWVVFAWVYFGSPLPHSVVAKQVIQRAIEFSYARWLLDSLWIPLADAVLRLEIAVWLAWVAIGMGAAIALPRLRPLLPLVAFAIVFPVAMWLGRAPRFPWYLIPVTWCSIVLAVVGSAVLAGAFGRKEDVRGARVRLAVVVALWALEAVAMARWANEAFRFQRAYQENEIGLRRRVGEWLKANTAPGATVAMEAIGYQGTTANRRILDLAGLVSPRVVQIHREEATHGRALVRVLETLQPDALVLRSYEVDANLHLLGGPVFETEGQLQRFQAAYREAIRMSAPHPELWGNNSHLTIYRRAVGQGLDTTSRPAVPVRE